MLSLRLFFLGPARQPPVTSFLGCLITRPKKTTPRKLITSDHRLPSTCLVSREAPDPKPCFDIREVQILRGTACHEKLIRSFLYTHYWTREPSCTGLWMSLHSPYLAVLTERYSTSGDRYLAFERQSRTHELKLIGVLCANKVFPWYMDELEEWANNTVCKPDRHRMYFISHCYRSPNLFNRYNIPYIYDMEVLGTASEVSRQGVGHALVKKALQEALELRHPLIQLIAKNSYASRICAKAGMKREWAMDYTDFVDDAGQRVFFPRRPHFTVSVYTKVFDPKEGVPQPCKPPFI